MALLRERINNMRDEDLRARQCNKDVSEMAERHKEERSILGGLASTAQILLRKSRALASKLKESHLEVVQSIFKVAMDLDHSTEEETAIALTNAVRDMSPMLENSLVA